MGGAADGAVGSGLGGVKERRGLLVAVLARPALRPRDVAAGVGDGEDAGRRRAEGDLHEVLAAGAEQGGLRRGGAVRVFRGVAAETEARAGQGVFEAVGGGLRGVVEWGFGRVSVDQINGEA